jgi:hypothetical protein
MLELGRGFGVLTANIGARGGYATASIQSNFGNPWRVLSALVDDRLTVSTPAVSDNQRVTTRARTFAGLVADRAGGGHCVRGERQARPGRGRQWGRMQRRLLKGRSSRRGGAATGSGTLTNFHSTHEEMPCPR